MDALFSTPAARRLALTALILAAAPRVGAQIPAESFEDVGYVAPSLAPTVARARKAALKKLRAPRCQRVFTEFTNPEGLSLDGVLVARGHSAESHLRQMAFLDGSGILPCGRRDVYAFTKPGSMSVFLCDSFRKLTSRSPTSAATLLIHEMLHSLGAGEAPSPGLPTAYQITDHVELRCGF